MTSQPDGHLPLNPSNSLGEGPVSEPFDELLDTEGLLFEEGVWSDAEKTPSGAGLPAGYSMRHDPHYIDELFGSSELRQIVRLRPNEIEAPPARSIPRELSASVSKYGVLQPILVRRRAGRYELVAGAKRLAAARACGLTHIPCILHGVSDAGVDEIRDATNVHGSGHADVLSKVLPLLGQSLHSVISCVQLAASDNLRSQDHGVKKLIHTEATQAAQLTWCASLLCMTPGLNLTSFDASQVLDNVLTGRDADPSWHGLRIERYVDRPCKVHADRRLLSLAMVSAQSAVAPIARQANASAITLHLAQRPRNNMMEYGLSVKTSKEMRLERIEDWLDLCWKDRPGGFRAGVELLASKRACELHGGNFRLSLEPERFSMSLRVPMS